MNNTGISRVLVIGGTGMIGGPVTRRLIAAGYDVTVGVRSVTKLTPRATGCSKVISIDVTRPETLAGAIDGFDAVQLILPSGPSFEDCFRVEAGGAKAVAEAVKKAGVKRISYLSGATNLHEDHPYPPARAKWQAEQAIRISGVPFTIWRAGWFNETLTRLVRFGIIGLPGRGLASAHWLAADDYGDFVARSFASSEVEAKTLYAFGPEPISLIDAARVFRNTCYSRRMILSAPLSALLLATKLVGAEEAWFGAKMLQFLELEPEYGSAAEAVALVGSPVIKLKDWCERLAV